MLPKLDGEQMSRLAVSAHYLETAFMSEVEDAGLSKGSTIHDLENLDMEKPGLIRSKGLNVRCPHDHQMGAAYVDCLSGEDHVGEATHFLSYSWSYTVGDIVDTLSDFCQANGLNPKRTYIWICCLCVNQHRVAASKMSGMTASSPVDFFTIFGQRVKRIGHLLAMMAPWDRPTYLTRVWCIFELSYAHENSCRVTVVMPPKEKELLELELFGDDGLDNIDVLYDALAKTRIQDAQASFQCDCVAILGWIETSTGYASLNHRVNQLLRNWARQVIGDLAKKHLSNPESDLATARVCNQIGLILDRNGEFDAALEVHRRALRIRLDLLGPQNARTAETWNSIGQALHGKGDNQHALLEYQKALDIREEVLGPQHFDVAITYNGLGQVLLSQGLLERALICFRKAIPIFLLKRHTHHRLIATCYRNIGLVLQGQGQLVDALEHFQKALSFRELCLGPTHPDTAASYCDIAALKKLRGDTIGAVTDYKKALPILEVVLGPEHPATQEVYEAIRSAHESA
ncbi:Kinesin light chain [Seminavis robusta]|uniref:Kinesin light chain n=1 Tax=Seminavis robusta TaxID=568900 RepID=A0A9N8DBH4_9STRA|nr:Kinesin light chain [Seminavis robusta]|eukprot:Sro23_g016150.1 Kinesin light chain (516) ;mRNA; r:164720-166267